MEWEMIPPTISRLMKTDASRMTPISLQQLERRSSFSGILQSLTRSSLPRLFMIQKIMVLSAHDYINLSNGMFRESISSISHLTDRSNIDEAIRRSIRTAKEKLCMSKRDSESDYGTFGKGSEAMDKKENCPAWTLKESVMRQGKKLVTFANVSVLKERDRVCTVQKNEHLLQKMGEMEELNLQLHQVISHLKEQNASLSRQVQSAQCTLNRVSPLKHESRRGSSDDSGYQSKLSQCLKSLQLKEKVIALKDQEIQRLTLGCRELESFLRKAESQYSILKMHVQRSKEALTDQLKSYQGKIVLLTKQLSIVKKFVPNSKAKSVEKQSSAFMELEQENTKLVKESHRLKVQNSSLQSKLLASNKQNRRLEKQEELMEDMAFKEQIRTQNIVKQALSHHQLASLKKLVKRPRGSQSVKYLTRASSASKRSRKSSSKNLFL